MDKRKIANDAVYLIDATGFCYRAYYALQDLSTSQGQATNAIYGFVNMLNKLLREHSPKYLAACFDVSRETFRQKKFTEYKIQRPSMPDTLSSQIPLIKKILKAYNISIFEKKGYEADDIIATLANNFKKSDRSVVVVSSDKDILQLVDENTYVLNMHKDKGLLYAPGDVVDKYTVESSQIVDLLALMGDSTDNIPGAQGVGEKTAVKLLKEFGSVDNLFKNIKNIKSDSLRDTIKNNQKEIKLSKELVQLNLEVPFSFTLEDLKAQTPNYKELYKIFKELEFKRFLKELPLEEVSDFDHEDQIRIDDFDTFKKEIKNNQITLACDYQSDQIYFSAKEGSFYQTGLNSQEAVLLLADQDLRKVGYDFKRVSLLLNQHQIKFSNLYFDLMVAAYLVDPSKSEYSFESIAWDYLEIALKEKSIPSSLSLVEKLQQTLAEELKRRKLENLFYEVEMPLVGVLAQMESNGAKIDKQALEKLSQEVNSKLDKLRDNIYSQAGEEFNINSPKQLRQILFDKLKLPVIKKTKTGPSTNEEVLRRLVKKHKLPALLLEYRQLMKLKTTYIDTLPVLLNSQTGRIHASFSQVVTETGRLSCSQPNLQNIPIRTELGKKIREAFVAANKQTLLVSADYSQIELRLLAHFSKDPVLLSAFNNDKDIHKNTAALIYDIDESKVTYQMRELAKRINFSIIYGLSAYGLSRDLDISQEEAQRFIDAYFLKYSKVAEYVQSQIEKCEKDGFVTTILGRRRYIPEINSKNAAVRSFAQRQAVNTPIQGSAADLIKQAMVDINQSISDRAIDAKMILQIHDELLFEVDKKKLESNLVLIKSKMEDVLRLDVPLKVDIALGDNWSQMKEV